MTAEGAGSRPCLLWCYSAPSTMKGMKAMSTTETKFVNRHRAVDDKPAFRFYKEGEIVELQCGPYGDFGSDDSLAALLNNVAYSLGAIKQTDHAYNVAIRSLASNHPDEEVGAERIDALIEELLEALNNALITDDEADPDRVPSWGYYEGTVFLHRASWWYQEADESAVNAWTTTEHPKEAVKDTRLVILGNPFDGFKFVGPFDGFDPAADYGDRYGEGGDWWVGSLEDPS